MIGVAAAVIRSGDGPRPLAGLAGAGRPRRKRRSAARRPGPSGPGHACRCSARHGFNLTGGQPCQLLLLLLVDGAMATARWPSRTRAPGYPTSLANAGRARGTSRRAHVLGVWLLMVVLSADLRRPSTILRGAPRRPASRASRTRPPAARAGS